MIAAGAVDKKGASIGPQIVGRERGGELGQSIERVVVPLDLASDSRAAIDMAARLAARWRVPLRGIFLEDEDLLDLSALPFACQVTLAAGIEPLTRRDLEAHFRIAAGRARSELQAAAEREGLDWSFEVIRGPFATEKQGIGEGDLVVAGAATRAIAGHFQVPSRWWSSLESGVQPLLLAQCEWRRGGSVVALLRRRGEPSGRALGFAAELAEFAGGSLTVAGAAELIGAHDFAAWLRDILGDNWPNLRTEPVALDAAALRRQVIELDCRLLVVAAGPAEDGSAERLRELFGHLACDVLIVR